MKRVLTITIAASLVVAACGSGDGDETPAASEEPAAEAPAPEEPAAEQEAEPADEPEEPAAAETQSEEPEPADEPAEEPEEPADEPADEPAGDDADVPPGLVITSLDDIPQVCLDQMADFLREIEPIVSSIDWQTASLGDFETIAEDFEAVADDFDEREAESGCDNMEFEGDGEFELLIGFARDVAPGTTGFLSFLDSFGSFDDDADASASGDSGDDGGATAATGEGFANCEEAIEWVQGLMDEYGSFMEVPASEIMRFAEISAAYVDCTPEQLEFFGTDEGADFLGGT